MTLEDLANYKGEWVTPASTTYHGEFTVYGTSAPSQAWGIVEALNVLEAVRADLVSGTDARARSGRPTRSTGTRSSRRRRPSTATSMAHNADPNAVPVPLEMLTSKPHAASLCGEVNPMRASATGSAESDADRCGRHHLSGGGGPLGKHGVVDQQQLLGVGIRHHRSGLRIHPSQPRRAVHARPESPNVIAGNKRPYNTLSAVLVTQNGRPLLVTGQHGGDQQGQGNMQVLVNMLDLGANVQAAGDMARFSHNQVSNELQMESQLFALVGSRLKDMGHKVASSNGFAGRRLRGDHVRARRRRGAQDVHRPMRSAPRRSPGSIERVRISERTARPPGTEPAFARPAVASALRGGATRARRPASHRAGSSSRRCRYSGCTA